MLSCKRIKNLFSIILIACMGLTTVCPPALAQSVDINFLPAPGQMMHLSQSFMPLTLKGVQPDPQNPFELDFIVDAGDTGLSKEEVKNQSLKLVKYFLAALTVPEDEQWVNLSPKEKDRIAPEALGVTVMGKDLLAQDYLLKQITASLVNPDEELGRKFWERIYSRQLTVGSRQETAKELSTANWELPTDILNRVWIVPAKAVVYEHNQSAFVVERKLKVMMEDDYFASRQYAVNSKQEAAQLPTADRQLSTLMKSVILPAIEKEVNEGEHFAVLRQIYDAMILATWYKKRLKSSILNQTYSNQNKTPGVDVADKDIKQKIYDRYLEAFQKGVFNFIKEEYDPQTKALAPRKYFSGGTEGVKEKDLAIITADAALTAEQMENLPVGTNEQYRIKVGLLQDAGYGMPDKTGKDNALLGFGKKKPDVLKITKEDLNETQDAVYPINSVDDISRVMAAGLGPNGINYSGEYAGFFGNFSGNNLREVNGITLMNELVVPENQPMLGFYTEGFDEIGTYEHDEFFGAAFGVDAKGRLGIMLAPFKNLNPHIVFENNRLLFATKEEGLVVSKGWGHFLTQKARETYFDGKAADEITEEEIKAVVLEHSQKAKAKVLKKVIGEFTSHTESVQTMWMPLKFGLVGTPAQYRWNQVSFFMRNLINNNSNYKQRRGIFSFLHSHSVYKINEKDAMINYFIPRYFSEQEFLLLNSPGDITKMLQITLFVNALAEKWGIDLDVLAFYSVIQTHDRNKMMDVSTFMLDKVLLDGKKDQLLDLTRKSNTIIHKADQSGFGIIHEFLDFVANPRYMKINTLPEYINDQAMTGEVRGPGTRP